MTTVRARPARVVEDLDDVQDEPEPLAPDAAPAPFLRPAIRAVLFPSRSTLLEGLLERFFNR